MLQRLPIVINFSKRLWIVPFLLAASCSSGQASPQQETIPISPLEIAVTRYSEAAEAERYVVSCMSGAGFDYFASDDRLIRLRADAPLLPPDGAYSRNWVDENGYGLAVAMRNEIRAEIGDSGDLPQPTIEKSDNLRYFETLDPDRANAYEDSRDECRTEAEAIILESRPFGEESPTEVYNRILASTEYSQAEQSWLKCMRIAGFEYSSIGEPYITINDRLNELMRQSFGFDDDGSPSVEGAIFLSAFEDLAEEELQVAKADHSCEPSSFTLSSRVFEVDQ